MAEPKHVDFLKQGMKVWHQWLHQNLDLTPDLSGANLAGAKLSRMDLSRVDLRGANLQGAHLRGAQLSYSLLDGANLSGADLSSAFLREADLRQALLGGANLNFACLVQANLSRVDLSGAKLRELDLQKANLAGANLSQANLDRVNLGAANLSETNLKGARIGLPETDPYIAAAQIRFGILLGQAQETTLPWYQRCKAAIETYNDVEERVILRFPLNRFQADYARLLALRAPMYRELGQFDESIVQFKYGLSYTERIDAPFLKAALLRDSAHLRAVQGNETLWSHAIDEALHHAVRVRGPDGERIYSLLKDLQGNGYKRLALDCFSEAQAGSVDSWLTDTSAVVLRQRAPSLA